MDDFFLHSGYRDPHFESLVSIWDSKTLRATRVSPSQKA